MSVSVELITKRFGSRKEVVGIEQVSFHAPKQRITSLLGPSGSGKSTLLRLIAGLEVPDRGLVRINDENVTHTPVQKRNVGFVFQHYALFRHMNVFANVAFGLSIRQSAKSEIADRVAELLKLVQLQGYEHRFPDQLSGGQRQRIALARALATNPSVLLLDEPFGALDTQVRIELREWLHQFHEKTHVTTLLVTHDQEEALELSEHVILLRNGKVEQAGSPAELYEHPANAFVASFLGGAKILTGSVVQGQAHFAQKALSTSVDFEDGAMVEAFVRPHDVKVEKATDATSQTRVVQVKRLAIIGSYAKLFLVLPDGDTICVQMPRHEFEEQGITQGDRVLLDLRNVRVSPLVTYVI